MAAARVTSSHPPMNLSRTLLLEVATQGQALRGGRTLADVLSSVV